MFMRVNLKCAHRWDWKRSRDIPERVPRDVHRVVLNSAGNGGPHPPTQSKLALCLMMPGRSLRSSWRWNDSGSRTRRKVSPYGR